MGCKNVIRDGAIAAPDCSFDNDYHDHHKAEDDLDAETDAGARRTVLLM